MENDLKKHGNEIANLFRSIAKNFRKYMAVQVGECNFTITQFTVIHELYTHPGISLKELSRLMGLSKSTVCGIVDRLEAHGSVIRSRDEEDRRAVKIFLTLKTLEMQESMNLIKENYMAEILRNANMADIEVLVKSLRKFDTLILNETKMAK